MKTVLLFRHAKSNRETADLDDFDRTLNKRGEKSARAMGEWFDENNLWPDHVICSDAVRARMTWDGAMKAGGRSIRTEWRHDLYLARPETLMAAIHETPPACDRVMLVGHNPGIGALASALCEHVTRRRVDDLKGFPTAAFAELDFDVDDWPHVLPGRGIVTRAASPKTIGVKEDQ